MRRRSTLAALLILAAALFSPTAFAQEAVPYSPEAMRQTYTKREVRIPMRDGVELFTAVYEPRDNSTRHPVMMERSCYGVRPYGEDEFMNFRSYAPYVDAGYIFVFQDVRGKNMSDGEFEEIRPFIEGKTRSRKASANVGQTDEASDTYDTLDWIVANTFNNGCVGQMGISYPGFYTTMAALSGHPALKAVSPQAPVTDWFHGDDVHHNGAFMMAEMVSFQPWFQYVMDNKRVQKGASAEELKFPELFHTDIYTDFLRIGTYMNYCEAYGDSLSYLRTIREHPDWDEYWESHTVTSGHLHDVKPAVMVVGGLFDKEDCYGALETYKSIREQSPETELYLVEGPWYHGGWMRGGMKQFWNDMYFGPESTSPYYMENIEYPFFAYYLEGKGEKPAPGARIFDSGTRTWTLYPDGWPLVDASETVPFYLCADGGISREVPQSGVASYVSDPSKPVPYHDSIGRHISLDYMVSDQRFASRRTDVLSFCTSPLTEAISLAGEVEASLMVDISSTDADFIVKLIDVFPDDFSWEGVVDADSEEEIPDTEMGGYQFLVRGEVMRGKYRESFADPAPFEPGEMTLVEFSMPDVAHTFLPGHSIMVQIQSSWFPLVDRNPQTFCNIYTCEESDYVKAQVNIHCGEGGASCIKLPVVR